MIHSREIEPHAGGWLPRVRATFALTRSYARLLAAEPLAIPAGEKPGEERVNAMRPRMVRAYSLVELIVVISIIALLLSLTGIAVVGWINSAKVKGTMATMHTLKSAIDAFVDERPMASGRGDPRSSAGPQPGRLEWRLPDGTLGYQAYFGALPPSPSAQIDLNDPLAPVLDENNAAAATMISKQFSNMVRAYFQGHNAQGVGRKALRPNGAIEWSSPAGNPTGEDYASIECLMLFLSRMSPRAKAVIDKMPSDCRSKNLDRDRAVITRDERDDVDLFEITDAWDRPLRWAVQRMTSDLVRWELRSAGKDGVFARPFTAPEQSDDVVLQGP